MKTAIIAHKTGVRISHTGQPLVKPSLADYGLERGQWEQDRALRNLNFDLQQYPPQRCRRRTCACVGDAAGSWRSCSWDPPRASLNRLGTPITYSGGKESHETSNVVQFLEHCPPPIAQALAGLGFYQSEAASANTLSKRGWTSTQAGELALKAATHRPDFQDCLHIMHAHTFPTSAHAAVGMVRESLSHSHSQRTLGDATVG